MSKKGAGKMMKKVLEKKIISDKLKVKIPAGKALPGPPLGPLLGQRGINIAAFCKDFNSKTSAYKEGVPLPCVVNVNPDRSYELTINKPPVPFYLFQAAGIERGAMAAGRESVGKISIKHVYEIAKIKSEDYRLQLMPLKQLVECIVGRAHSIGIEVVREIDPAEYGQFLEETKERVEQQLREIEEKKEAKLLRK